VDAGKIRIPPTITETTLRFHHDSFINLGSAGVSGGLIPIAKAFRQLLSTTNLIEVLHIEVLDASHQTLNIACFFNEWLKDNTKALPRLRILELTKVGLHQDDFEKFLIYHSKGYASTESCIAECIVGSPSLKPNFKGTSLYVSHSTVFIRFTKNKWTPILHHRINQVKGMESVWERAGSLWPNPPLYTWRRRYIRQSAS
jgi:hypothetical protein